MLSRASVNKFHWWIEVLEERFEDGILDALRHAGHVRALGLTMIFYKLLCHGKTIPLLGDTGILALPAVNCVIEHKNESVIILKHISFEWALGNFRLLKGS